MKIKNILLILVSTFFAGNLYAVGCNAPSQIAQNGLPVKKGYLEFLPSSELATIKAALPQVTHTETNSIVHSQDTIWYDENSMVYVYQDSIEVVVGTRANCVGRLIGSMPQVPPDVQHLKNLFGPDYKFMFPFRGVAGTDNSPNLRAVNFWSPPEKNGARLPVKWWRQGSRKRWNWVFPVGTVFGEVLMEKAPNQNWYVFEIRTRKRYKDGWEVQLFRPYGTATELSNAIKQARPNWDSSPNLTQVINHLNDKNTLVKNRWVSSAYGKVFPPVDGALDPIPAIQDPSLVVELLTKKPFVSMEGKIWKENGALQTYAPGSQGDFSIVPKGYELGMIPVNEVSCNRCHSETGRNIGHFDNVLVLYGEVWGEDRIFTWHPFEPNAKIYGPWDEPDGSRLINRRLIDAGLLVNEKPSSQDPDYKALPGVFVPDMRKGEEVQKK